MIYEATKVPPIRLTYLVITSSELWKWEGGQVLKTRSQKLGVCDAEREGFQMRLQKTLIRFSPMKSDPTMTS